MTFLLPLLFATALPVQPAGKCVLDEANALSADEFVRLENMCEALDKDKAGQLEVVVTDDFRGDEKEEFANKLFHTWGIGHKGKNDGILVVLSPKMRKWRIEVGYGLEGRITDAQAAEIGRNLGVPAWKAGRWGEGLISVVGTIAPLMYAEAKPKPVETKSVETSTSISPWWWLTVPVALFLGLLAFLYYRAETRRREETEREELARIRREHLAWEAEIRRRNAASRVYATSSAPASTPKRTPTPPSPVVAVVETPTYSSPTYDPPSYDSSSSDSGGGFDGGGGGDSGGGGAGGDF